MRAIALVRLAVRWGEFYLDHLTENPQRSRSWSVHKRIEDMGHPPHKAILAVRSSRPRPFLKSSPERARNTVTYSTSAKIYIVLCSDPVTAC
jgi:hypothetical protein